MKNMTDRANPWSVPIVVAQIPDTGLHREIEADRATRDAMAVVAGLREMGVGDLTVPKRMQAFGEAFYGRAAAYDLALAAGTEPLAQALCKNILDGEGIEDARRLAVYAEAAIAALAGTDEASLRSASWSFPGPA